MSKKVDLLKQLGWDDTLIKHFMINDSDYIEKTQSNNSHVEICDCNSIIITYNSELSGTAATVGTSNPIIHK